MTDAFGNALAGQAVSVMAGNSATVTPTVTTQSDGTVEFSVTSQTAGTSTVTASISSSSLSRDVTFIADVRTAQIAVLEVTQDYAVADGSTANTLRARVTDAFGNALAGQTVSVLGRQRRKQVSPTVITGPDGTVEISVTSQTAGASTVTASINSSSLSRNVTFVADVRTAQIAVLEVTQDYAVADGSTANTLRARVTDAFGNALAGQTVSVTAGNGATVSPTVITGPDGTGGNQCHQPDGGSQCSHCNHQQQHREPERDVYRRCQDGEDRRIWWSPGITQWLTAQWRTRCK